MLIYFVFHPRNIHIEFTSFTFSEIIWSKNVSRANVILCCCFHATFVHLIREQNSFNICIHSSREKPSLIFTENIFVWCFCCLTLRLMHAACVYGYGLVLKTLSKMHVLSHISLLYQIVHRTSVPSALAVDWIGKNLYWCDAERKTLEVSKANGLYPTVLISSGLKNPTDLALDPQTGYARFSHPTNIIQTLRTPIPQLEARTPKSSFHLRDCSWCLC